MAGVAEAAVKLSPAACLVGVAVTCIRWTSEISSCVSGNRGCTEQRVRDRRSQETEATLGVRAFAALCPSAIAGRRSSSRPQAGRKVTRTGEPANLVAIGHGEAQVVVGVQLRNVVAQAHGRPAQLSAAVRHQQAIAQVDLHISWMVSQLVQVKRCKRGLGHSITNFQQPDG